MLYSFTAPHGHADCGDRGFAGKSGGSFAPREESFGSAPKFAGAGKTFSKPEGGFKGGFKEGFKAGPKPAFAKTGFKPAGKSFASKAPRKA